MLCARCGMDAALPEDPDDLCESCVVETERIMAWLPISAQKKNRAELDQEFRVLPDDQVRGKLP